jgi:hypothetical protein
MENTRSIVWTEKDKNAKRTTFCGKYNKGYAACIKMLYISFYLNI